VAVFLSRDVVPVSLAAVAMPRHWSVQIHDHYQILCVLVCLSNDVEPVSLAVAEALHHWML
jgi:hypothetical protein